jgi:hypothetical protein
MGAFLAILAVVFILVTGGSHSNKPAEKPSAQQEPTALAGAAAPVEPMRPRTLSESLAHRMTTTDQLTTENANVGVAQPTDEEVPTREPNPCTQPDGSMVPNCAAIAKRTGQYVLAEQRRVINQWVHVWTR